MLTCKELVELVTDYLEGRMSLGDRLRFDMHVLMCRSCRAFVRQLKQTVRALGHLPADPVPKEMEQELLSAFRSWKAEP